MQVIGFFAKKIISTFCHPVGLSLLLLFAGMFLWRIRPKSRLGPFTVFVGALVLLVASLPIVGFLLLKPLETAAGPYADPAQLRDKGVRYIVVLSSELVTADRTLADRFGQSIFRTMEGIRLWKGVPGSKLVLSGGSMPGRQSQADAMAALPMEMGVPRKALVLETRVWDTRDEAKAFSAIVGKEPFALVTSASHMPRAMKYFKDFGLNPLPCPCEFKTRVGIVWYRWFWPSVEALRMSTWAAHEYIGTLWYSLKRKL
jgi:uncharacterized SAM-binding protein YcdF (DUF218 family)